MTSVCCSGDGGFGANNPEVDEYIKRLASPLDEIAYELRRIVLEVEPSIVERILFNQPWFIHNGPMCYIRVRTGYLYFGFQAGVALTDPHELLEGKGRAMRHIKLNSVDSIHRDQIVEWIKEAVKINEPGSGQFESWMKDAVDGEM